MVAVVARAARRAKPQGFCYSTDAIPSRLKALKDKVLLVGTAATGLAGSGYLLVTHETGKLSLDIKHLERELRSDMKELRSDMKALGIDITNEVKSLKLDIRDEFKSLKLDIRDEFKSLKLDIRDVGRDVKADISRVSDRQRDTHTLLTAVVTVMANKFDIVLPHLPGVQGGRALDAPVATIAPPAKYEKPAKDEL